MFGLGLALAAGVHAGNWPSWRGDLAGSGLAKGETVPLKWDTKQNVRWRVPLPDRGNSSPIVWGDKVFITQATDADKRRTVMCFDKRTGELLWRSGVTHAKKETTHKTNPYCSGSPATDGRIVVANFASAGVAAYDLDGQQLWHRDLGPQEHEWGSSTSPVLFGDVCILYHGPGPHSMLYALDKLSGRTVWKPETVNSSFARPAWACRKLAASTGKGWGSVTFFLGSDRLKQTRTGREHQARVSPGRTGEGVVYFGQQCSPFGWCVYPLPEKPIRHRNMRK